MHAVLTHLARRGVEAARLNQHGTLSDEYEYKMPTWGIVMLASTALIFYVASAAVCCCLEPVEITPADQRDRLNILLAA